MNTSERPNRSAERDAMRAQVPKRRVWPPVFILGLLVVGGALGVWRLRKEPEPFRVLIAVDLDGYWWDGSQPAAVLADRLESRLERLGFDPVRGGDPSVTKVLEQTKDPEEAARKLRAAFWVEGHLAAQVTEDPVEGKYFEIQAQGPIAVHFGHESAGAPVNLHAWAGARSRADAMRTLSESLAEMTFDAVIPRLAAHRTIETLSRGSDISAAAKMRAARTYVEQRETTLRGAGEAYAQLARQRSELANPGREIAYESLPQAQDILAGVGPRGVLVRTSNKTPFLSPTQQQLQLMPEPETLEWRADGKSEVFWRGRNVYGYPSAEAQGAVVFVEDIFGWAKTVTVSRADGSTRRVRLDTSHGFVSPKPAPGGKVVALYDRPCPDCRASIRVLSLLDGRDVFEAPGPDGEYAGYAWLDDHQLAFVTMPAGEVEALNGKKRGQELWLADVASNPISTRRVFAFARDLMVSLSSAEVGGLRLALEVRGGPGSLGLFGLDTRQLRTVSVPGLAERPSFSPNGKAVVFEANGDVYWLRTQTGEVIQLTDTPLEERHPTVSWDGRRVYFESLADDPNFPGRRVVSAIAYVSAPL